MPVCGVTTSFIGWLCDGSELRSGVASTWEKPAGWPFTSTSCTARSWKSRLNSDRFCVALAVMVVTAESNALAVGSKSSPMSYFVASYPPLPSWGRIGSPSVRAPALKTGGSGVGSGPGPGCTGTAIATCLRAERHLNAPLEPRCLTQATTKYPVSYTHLRAHETDSYLVCRL